MEILKCENVRKVYGSGNNQVVALDHIDLSVQKGEFVAIVGASGSGKSTLLHILGSVDKPTEGKVLIEGTELSAMNRTQAAIFRRRKVGLVYQFYNLIPTLTVRKNILMPLLLDKELVAVSLIEERIGLVRPGNVLSEWVCRSSHMGVSRRTASVSADKHNIVPLCVLVNIPGKKKSLNKRFVETSAFAKILNCSVGCSVVQGQVKRCGRCCGGFGLPLAAFAGQKLDGFGKGLAVKLHDKINGIAALALAVSKPLVSTDGQAVMFFPAVFSSAFD